MIMNLWTIITLQLFQMRYFSYLYIYTHLQASSWRRFYDLLLKYASITLVIVCQSCPPLGWLPMLIDTQTTKNFCTLGFGKKNIPVWCTVLSPHKSTFFEWHATSMHWECWETCLFLTMLSMTASSQCLLSGSMSCRSVGTQHRIEQAFPAFAEFLFYGNRLFPILQQIVSPFLWLMVNL